MHIDDEVNGMVAKASAAFGRPRCLGSKWNQASHKAESLQSCGAANTIVCMRNVDSLSTVCQKTEPLPYKLP